jgi:hypothetical protein
LSKEDDQLRTLVVQPLTNGFLISTIVYLQSIYIGQKFLEDLSLLSQDSSCSWVGALVHNLVCMSPVASRPTNRD